MPILLGLLVPTMTDPRGEGVNAICNRHPPSPRLDAHGGMPCGRKQGASRGANEGQVERPGLGPLGTWRGLSMGEIEPLC
jgi:hypothetical protein